MKVNTEKIQEFILKNYRRREFYGYQLQRDLQQQGYELDLTRLYKVLNQMEKKALLSSKWVKSMNGPNKKMYSLGEDGKEMLEKILLDAIHTVHSFYGDYLFSIRERVDVFDLILNPICQKIDNPSNIGFMFFNFTPLVSIYFQKIRSKFDANYYCVKPKGLDNIEIHEDVVMLNGECHDIPLKDSYLDALVMVDLPSIELLPQAVRECSRVLRSDGVLSLLTPSILLSKEKEPLSIGDFVEKTEHTIIEQASMMDFTKLSEALSEHFYEIEDNSVVHISTVTCIRK